MRFAVNGNRFRVDIAFCKLFLPVIQEDRIKAHPIDRANRFHAHRAGVHAPRDIIVVLYEVGRDFGEVLPVPLLERGAYGTHDGILRVIGRRIILIIGEVV